MFPLAFEVWAPTAERVELLIEGRRLPLQRRDDGCWDSDHEVEGGVDYQLSVDGSEPLPDPRSPWQPEGVHGPSRTVDHDAFEWTDHRWRGAPLSGAVIYELHIGTFTPGGTFDSAIERLGHLVDLGVTAIELLPVAEFSGDHGWGYDGVDLYAPHHAYGGPDGLKRLVDAAHERGLAVIMDVVYNHLGPTGNYLARFAPYFTDKYSTPWGEAINFDDAYSPGVRSFVIENALMWLRDYHCDGLRLDAVHAIVDTSATHVLEELAVRVEELESELGRTLWVIAESDLNDPRLVSPRAAGGYGLDAQWSDDFHHALHSVLTGETDGYYSDFGAVEHLTKALTNAFVYDGVYSPHRKRRHGRTPSGIGGHRFLGYLQNHDQIGNRAQGERSSALMSRDMLKVAAAFVMTSPFIPMLFQGEEWGASTPFQYFTDHAEEELGRAVSEGRKREFAAFGWDPNDVPDPQDPETFRRSKLKWSEIDDQPCADLLDWHRRLIRLRKETPALSDGRRDLVVTRVEGDVLIVERGDVTIVCNLGAGPATASIDESRRTLLLLASTKEPRATDGSVELAAESVAIYSA